MEDNNNQLDNQISNSFIEKQKSKQNIASKGFAIIVILLIIGLGCFVMYDKLINNNGAEKLDNNTKKLTCKRSYYTESLKMHVTMEIIYIFDKTGENLMTQTINTTKKFDDGTDAENEYQYWLSTNCANSDNNFDEAISCSVSKENNEIKINTTYDITKVTSEMRELNGLNGTYSQYKKSYAKDIWTCN